jgi:hypothetical protein
MPLHAATRRRLVIAWAAAVVLILGGLGFVFYYMHSVYEADDVLTAGSVPSVVRTNLEARFPGVGDVTWKFDDGHYEAGFDWKGMEEVEAYFSPDGAWAYTEFPASLADLPDKARSYLAAQAGCEAAAVERIELANGNISFEVELRGTLTEWDCAFDAEGNLVSRTRDGSVLEEQAEPPETAAK